MALSPDVLSDRLRLKKESKRWRLLALVFLFAGLLIASVENKNNSFSTQSTNHIARVTITDVIVDDSKRDAMLQEIANDPHVKAVLLRMDSPGGTTVGGEELYRQIDAINSEKPVIVIMRTLCTSACYMASLGAEHVLARSTSLTASIGVLLDSFEVTELAKKLGIETVSVKSGALKAAPSPTEKFLPEQRAYIQSVINDSFAEFVALVKKKRHLSDETLALVKDGRVVTGGQAYRLKLIDGLGGEREALEWLETEKKLDAKLPVFDWEPEEDVDDWISSLKQSAGNIIFGALHQRLDGLKSIWQPTLK